MAKGNKIIDRNYIDVLGSLNSAIADHVSTVDAIVKEYGFLDAGDSLEIETACNKLISAFDKERKELEEIITGLSGECDDLQYRKDELQETLNGYEGWAKIKINSHDQREKLEAFVTSEIWPHYNEQNNYEI